MRANRGTLAEPGKDSPFRNRSVEENLRVFREMRERKAPGRFHGASREDRHGKPQRESPRSGDLPVSVSLSVAGNGQRMVHLSDVHLCSSD